MSIQLVSFNDCENKFYFSDFSWFVLLHICKQFKWRPEGVHFYYEITDDMEDYECEPLWYKDDYYSNEGKMDYFNPGNQLVRETDASNLSFVLEELVNQESGGNQSEKELPIKFCSDMEIEPVIIKYIKKPFVYFSDEINKSLLNKFISFCRKGGFYICRQ